MCNFMKLLQWNAGGLSQEKRTQILTTLVKEDVDVFCIVEANLTLESLKFHKFPGYSLYVLPKSRKVASGILVGVKCSLISSFAIVSELNSATGSELVCTEVWKDNRHYKIFMCYSPPGNTKLNFDAISFSRKTMLVGDFNAHSTRWNYSDINNAGKILEDLLDSTSMEILYHPSDPYSYLHYNGTLTNPDLTLVSIDLAPSSKRNVIYDPGSGHRMILTTINENSAIKRSARQKRPQRRWNFKKANWSAFTNNLEESFRDQGEYQHCSIDSSFNKFCDRIHKAAKKWIPRGKPRNYKPFWSPYLQTLRDKCNKARIAAEQSNRAEEVQNWRKSVAILRKEIYEAKRKSFNSFISKIDYRTDSKKVFKYLNNLKTNSSFNSKTPMSNGSRIFTNDNDISNAFILFYSKSHRLSEEFKKSERALKRNNRNAVKSNGPHIRAFSDNFTKHELNDAINGLKNGKSPGPDYLHPEFIKNLGPISRSLLLMLINKSWHSNSPSIWKKAFIIPILKQGKPSEQFDSYRPIALTSILAKTMERMIAARLTWFLEHNGLLCNSQAGFRRYHSTSQQVAFLSQSIKDELDCRNSVLTTFVDFSSAYDKVWRPKLISKLISLGISGNMLCWLRDFLTQRLCSVKYGNSLSKYKHMETGLPQGAVLSPILFNVYINDLTDTLESVPGLRTSLFADDLSMWASEPRDSQDRLNLSLNRALDQLGHWCNENAMIVNESKTTCQFFTLNRKPFQPDLKFKNCRLQKTDNTKYLGCVFDNKLNWNSHVKYISDKVLGRLPVLKRLAGCKWGCGRETLNTTFRLFIQPIFSYCNEILISASPAAIQKLQTIQNQALRIITGAVRTTPILAMQSLTKTPSVKDAIERDAILLYEKLVRLPNNDFWRTYDVKANRNLKTQKGFIQYAHSSAVTLEVHHNFQILCNPLCPLTYRNISVNLDLDMDVSKKHMSEPQIRAIALSTIQNRYPEDSWLHVYTDGSLFNDEDGAGAGVCCDLFSFYTPIGAHSTHYDGEIEAIYIALKQLTIRSSSFQNAVILSDSLSALQSLSNRKHTDNIRILECIDLCNAITVTFQWIPAHCGIPGNEAADFLAKKGAGVLQKPLRHLSFHSVKLLIRRRISHRIRLKATTESADRSWAPLIKGLRDIPDSPRSTAVALFRLLTGHDCLPAHLHRFNLIDSPICPLCRQNQIFDASHLDSCCALAFLNCTVQRYWKARELMAS